MTGQRLARNALPLVAALSLVLGSTPASRRVSAQPRDTYDVNDTHFHLTN